METYNGWLNNRKTFCLITGASRGLGKTLALRFAQRLGPGSVVVLIATDSTKLSQCKEEINHLAPQVKVDNHTFDLSKPNEEQFRKLINASLTNTNSSPGDFEQVIIVHNAATIGAFKWAEDASDPDEWVSYLQLNLISTVCLNSVFLKIFTDKIIHRLIINITSLAAFKPVLSAGFYNTGKAARDNFFLTLAGENPSVTVLSYSPGMLQTDMGDQALSEIIHPGAKQYFTESRANGRMLTCDQTTDRLFQLLQSGEFKSGERVDYHGRK